MALSKKAKLLAANPSLKPGYVVHPDSNPVALADELKLIREEAAMYSAQVQRVIDKMMPIVGYMDQGHFVAVATCDVCGKQAKWTADAAPKDARVAFTKFRDRKWQASRKSLTCPTCVNKKKHPTTEFVREKPLKPIGEALREAVIQHDPVAEGYGGVDPLAPRPDPDLAEGEPQVEATTAPTDKAKAAKRKAYGLLLDHYDEGHKRYNGDWSDRKIAELAGLSEVAVAKIREDDFGPAGPPPQLIDLKERITRMEAKLRDREAQVLQAMDSIPEMQRELDLMKSQLQAVITAHGWSA